MHVFFRRAAIGMLVLFLVFPSAAIADGSIVITEVMYDPLGTDTNREWIEIYNSSTLGIELSKYIFFSDGVGSSKHSLTAVTSATLPAGSYAVIVQNPETFKNDYPSYSGLIFDSSWTGLTATSGKSLVIQDSASITVDQVTYNPALGATNDGNSLQKGGDGKWTASTPTPGSGALSSSTTTTTTDTAKTVTSYDAPKVKVPMRMNGSIALPDMGTVGIPIEITPTVFGYEDDYRYWGEFYYAFGDGTTVQRKIADPVSHVYTAPGTYAVTLKYSRDANQKKADLTVIGRITINPAGVAISSVTDRGGILFTNSGELDVDLSGWNLQAIADSGPYATFQFPEGTTILAGKSVTLLPPTLGFVARRSDAFLMTLETGEIAFAKETPPPQDEILPIIMRDVTPTMNIQEEKIEPKVEVGLTANAASAPALEEESKSIIPYLLALPVVLLLAILALRRFLPQALKKVETQKSETEEIADAIRIVE
ncbi:MAG: lamin tail domain-containing protein [Candidatus Pacebacteria bacterium]|nr:lamin tail domain-containing protein [Candidatus Paceibacterota bacterium]